jgi:hypothetical protein
MTEQQDKGGVPADKMLSIWFFVSIVLGVYGIIVTAIGVMTAMRGEMPKSVMGQTNPSLWWGAVMVVFALLLFVADRIASRGRS